MRPRAMAAAVFDIAGFRVRNRHGTDLFPWFSVSVSPSHTLVDCPNGAQAVIDVFVAPLLGLS